jgi:hypothetical protein
MAVAANTFQFTILLCGLAELGDDALDSRFNGGCDDALPVSRDGKVYLDFMREASSHADAVEAAIVSLRAAGFEPQLVDKE